MYAARATRPDLSIRVQTLAYDHLTMALFSPSSQLRASAEHDIGYVKASFVPMDEGTQALVERGALPSATYLLTIASGSADPPRATG
jgi:hypothetical protein